MGGHTALFCMQKLVDVMKWDISNLDDLKIAVTQLLRDERALERLHNRYLASTMAGGFRRTQTTTYNARTAQAVEQRDASRKVFMKAMTQMNEESL